MKSKKIVLSLILVSILVLGGCINTQEKKTYTCPDGRNVSDLDLCGMNSSTRVTVNRGTLQTPNCRFYDNGTCEDRTGTYYVTGICANDIKELRWRVCDMNTEYCEPLNMTFDCNSIGKICMKTPEGDLALNNSPMNIVKCAGKEEDMSWYPRRFIYYEK